jgi:DNA-binding NtrC family response regulator
VKHFLDRFSPASGVRISQAAMRILMAHPWPGNVRQLENVIERAIALGSGRKELSVTDLPNEFRDAQVTTPIPSHSLPEEGLDLTAYLASIERELIRASLERTGGNRNKAAELLRVKRTTLVEKIRRLSPESRN